jgi:cell division protein FtsB
MRKDPFLAIKEKIKRYANYALLLLSILLSVSLVRNIIRINKAKDSITDKQEQVDKLAEESKDLARKLEQTESDEYIEEQLRDNLGLSKEGEIVIVLPDEDVLRSLAPTRTKEEEVLPEPNWKKWARLFEVL